MALKFAAPPRALIFRLGDDSLGSKRAAFPLNSANEVKVVCSGRCRRPLVCGMRSKMVDDKDSQISKRCQKDLNSLPKPLTMADLSGNSNDGSKVRIAFKGVPGAYSEDAALKAYPQCETVPCKEFEDAFEVSHQHHLSRGAHRPQPPCLSGQGYGLLPSNPPQAVELWLADKAVLPIENSLGGSIHRNYDLLLRHRLHIVGEVQMPVNFSLLALPGVRLEQLKRVISHPQALAQTDHFLSKLGVVRENVDDTAAAAEYVASSGLTDVGVVAGSRAAEIYGLNILAPDIQDDPDSITRFIVLARDPIIPRTDKPFKTSVVFSLEEGPGVLFKALAVFALREINLTKMESRPQRKKPLRVLDDSDSGSAKYFDYIFYIDFEASMADPRAQNALEHLQEFAPFIRVLGCYPVDTL